MAKHLKKPKRRPLRTAIGLLVPAVLTALFLHWSNTSLKACSFDPVFADLPEGFDGCRIVVLADLHSTEFGPQNETLFSAVEAQKPDYIFVAGDLGDRFRGLPEHYAADTAAGLTAIAPTYYVTGNHEWAAGMIGQLRELFEESGVTYLRNGYISLFRGGEEILLAGIEDPNGYADQKTPQEVADTLRAEAGDAFWLLLAHRNNRFPGEYCRLGADLTLCGHGHGGIWRLPFTDGLISTTMEWFPSWTNGFYTCFCNQCDSSTVFVSRGLGNSPRIPRLFNRPEVAVITLKNSP